MPGLIGVRGVEGAIRPESSGIGHVGRGEDGCGRWWEDHKGGGGWDGLREWDMVGKAWKSLEALSPQRRDP